MAKELPYFKFEPSQWQNGDIQMCSNEAKLYFINICCSYWSKTGELSEKFALVKCCNNNKQVLDELYENNIILIENNMIVIKFLDEQLSDFIDLRKARSASGKKGGQNGGVRPEEERVKGNQLYFLLCEGNGEKFIKMGTTSNSVSRRYSGKMPYQYKVVFQLFTDQYIDLENQYCDILAKCEYTPKLNFSGQKECYKISEYDKISGFLKKNHGIALAPLKRNEAIREEKIREDKRREEKIKPTKLSLMSNANASDVSDLNKEYFEISKAFYELFKNNADKLDVKWSHLDNAKADNFIQPIRMLIESDKRTIEDLRLVWKFLQSDEFWMPNIQSSNKLRKNFDQLITKAKQNGKQNTANNYIESIRNTDLWKNA